LDEPYFAMGFLFHAPTGKVMLHLRGSDAPSNPGMWHLFGGRSEEEDGDDPAATWRREMQEEVGITVPPEHVVPLRTYILGRRRHVFYCPWPRVEAPITVYEGAAAAWFTLEEALALPNLVDRARTDLLLFRDAIGHRSVAATPKWSDA
jgi:8-oxo-dGTP pyrophosphatase MutT (NUDIX family)